MKLSGANPRKIGLIIQNDSLTLKSVHLFFLVLLVAGITIWVFRSKLTFLFMNVMKNWDEFKQAFVPVLLLSCGVWTPDLIRLKLIALALSSDFSLNLIVTVSVLSFLFGILLFTPGGLGIIEGGLISLLVYSGLSPASAGSFVFLERFISYEISSIVGFLYLSYYGGFKIWNKARREKLP